MASIKKVAKKKQNIPTTTKRKKGTKKFCAQKKYRAARTKRPVRSRPKSRLLDLAKPIVPRLRIRHNILGKPTLQRPQLLFRAFESTHQLIARNFLNPQKIVHPPDFLSQNFSLNVTPHLMRDESYQSPFLSLAENPKRCLLKINDSSRHDSFAIFDFNKLELDAKKRYGDSDVGPYLVPSICQQHKLFNLPKRYTGRGEWLVWGSIECEPVAIFSRQEVLELFKTCESLKTVSCISGLKLGKCLRNVPQEYSSVLGLKLLRAFKVRGCLPRPTLRKYGNFLYGLRKSSNTHYKQLNTFNDGHINKDIRRSQMSMLSHSEMKLTTISPKKSLVYQERLKALTNDLAKLSTTTDTTTTTTMTKQAQAKDASTDPMRWIRSARWFPFTESSNPLPIIIDLTSDDSNALDLQDKSPQNMDMSDLEDDCVIINVSKLRNSKSTSIGLSID